MSYQPEERYWTDYLRIALPVVGLLLMLGLFWYWASAVIGDDDNQPGATATSNVALVTQAPPTPTVQGEVTIPVTAITPAPTQGSDTGNPDAPTSTPAADEDPTEPSGDEPLGKGFRVGDVVVTIDEVNLRADTTQDSEAIELMPVGTELEVTEEGVEDGDYIWIGVRDTANDLEGFVADEFVESAEE